MMPPLCPVMVMPNSSCAPYAAAIARTAAAPATASGTSHRNGLR